jgi:aldose sugar dehydrogenase
MTRVVCRKSALAALTLMGCGVWVWAQTTQPPPAPEMTRADLRVRTVRTGFSLPTGLAFLGADDYLVTEKATGRVKRVRQGTETVVLDLGVNSASERGLLGIALHPNFPTDPGVYF